MKIGLIVAIADEIEAMLAEMGEPVKSETVAGIAIREYNVNGHELFVANSGAGEIYAAGAAQLLISHFGVQMLLNFGICGGLTPEMSLCSTVIVGKVVHYDYDVTELDPVEIGQYPGYSDCFIPADEKLIELAKEVSPELREVICASADKFVGNPEKKAELHRLYNAEICEMEAAGILLTANRCGVPALLIKAVSDSATGGAEEFSKMASDAARVAVNTLIKIIDKINQ
ncbi:MAG: 5'-methylthioadenosine/S-adenosylhomocysteine nucleosidase [Oscillospiraceae bacterium]|nr:5'-methylthioadenosine/S-adenosylhomocysteine nucleosidase [Oscillospiraceae bacterium]